MIDDNTYKQYLQTGSSNQKCAVCEERIPKDIPRVSFGHRTQYGSFQYSRVCFLCIMKFNSMIGSKKKAQFKKIMVTRAI